VVVLDEKRVVQAESMVGASADADGVLLERAQRWRGLAGVEDRDAPSRCLDEMSRHGRDPRQALEKVERDPLGREQRACRAAYLAEHRARLTGRSIVHPRRQRCGAIDLREGLARDGQPGDDQGRLGHEHAVRAHVRRYSRLGRHIAAADVLGQRAGNEVAICGRIQRESHVDDATDRGDWQRKPVCGACPLPHLTVSGVKEDTRRR
jgi:hypothetical protein